MTARRRPLRVAVVAPRPVPFAPGGAERHWDALVRALGDAGHDAELVALDSPESTLPDLLASYRRFLELDLSAHDVVVSGKYPSWMVRHPRHVRHLNHPLRGLYDLYPTHLAQPDTTQRAEVARHLDDGAAALLAWAEERACRGGADWALPGPWARAVIEALDADASARISAHAVVSEAVALRPSYQGGLLPTGVPLAVVAPLTDLLPTRPPVMEPSGPMPGIQPGAHFLTFGRLAREKRFDLAIDAFGRSGLGRRDPEPFELWIAGTGPDEERLRALAARTPGVHLLGRCSDDELATCIASSVAVIATPRDEDYGLVAAEAHAAGRPVLTVSDSGGIAEQVGHDGGIVTPPFARLLGAAIARLAHDPARADRLGRAGRDRVAQLSWDPLVRLIEQQDPSRYPSPSQAPTPSLDARPRVVMLSTFLAEPVTGGGSRRLRAVAAGLGRRFEMTVVALTNEVSGVRRRILDDGVVQIAVGRSAAHLRADHEMQAICGIPVDDIGASVLFAATPAFASVLDEQLADADAVVLAHPFLAPALPSALSCPVVYDAHNVEIDLKARLLEGRPGARRLLEWCEQAEASALVRASLVSAVSIDDLGRLCPPGCGHRNLVVPNGVDDHLLNCPTGPGPERAAARARLLADLELAGDRRPIVLFVGSSHQPNHQAADRLAELARANPDLLVVLAGGHAERPRTGPASVGSFADRDLRRLLLAADVIVNPVAVGSGTNLKLIEALASGTPVVATATGARGLDGPERVLQLVAPDGLLGGIRSVLDRPGPARARAAAGQELATAHRWSRVLTPLEAALADLVGVRLGP